MLEPGKRCCNVKLGVGREGGGGRCGSTGCSEQGAEGGGLSFVTQIHQINRPFNTSPNPSLYCTQCTPPPSPRPDTTPHSPSLKQH